MQWWDWNHFVCFDIELFSLLPMHLFFYAKTGQMTGSGEVTNHCILHFYKKTIRKIIWDLSKTTLEIEFFIIIVNDTDPDFSTFTTFNKKFLFSRSSLEEDNTYCVYHYTPSILTGKYNLSAILFPECDDPLIDRSDNKPECMFSPNRMAKVRFSYS